MGKPLEIRKATLSTFEPPSQNDIATISFVFDQINVMQQRIADLERQLAAVEREMGESQAIHLDTQRQLFMADVRGEFVRHDDRLAEMKRVKDALRSEEKLRDIKDRVL